MNKFPNHRPFLILPIKNYILSKNISQAQSFCLFTYIRQFEMDTRRTMASRSFFMFHRVTRLQTLHDTLTKGLA